MYKVFFKESSFLVTDDTSFCGKEGSVIYNGCKQELESIIFPFLSKDILFQIPLITGELENTWKDFKSLFVYKEAAGGIVCNGDTILVIKRWGIYDLPKGHLEKNELPEEGAVREVTEECGIDGLQISGRLPDTYHIYLLDGRYVLKKTYWYKMTGPAISTLTPQIEEGIEEVKWIPRTDISAYFADSYLSIRELLDNFFFIA